MIAKIEIVERLESLVFQDWSTNKHPTVSFVPEVLPREYCGVVFFGDFAYAVNGQFFIRISSASTDKPLYYQYNTASVTYDDIFVRKGIMKEVSHRLTKWYQHSVKVKKEDLYMAIKTVFPAIKRRRNCVLNIEITDNSLGVAFLEPEGEGFVTARELPFWGGEGIDHLQFTVNANHFYKALEIMEEYYIVEICTDPDIASLVLLKGNNRFKSKPDIRIGLAKIDMSVFCCPSRKINI